MQFNFPKISLFLLLLVMAGGNLLAQNTTIDGEGKKEEKQLGQSKGNSTQVLIIPFDPKLYMSEIDKKIGTENRMTFDQIRSTFRSGLDNKLLAQIKTSNSAYSLLADSVKNKKDLEMIYKSINYTYDKVTPDGSVPNSPGEKEKPRIVNGQLQVEMDNEYRFMNTNISNPRLLTFLATKYKSEYFVFINELDIKNKLETYDPITDTYKREVAVHYTVFDKNGKKLNAGIATTEFSSTVNDTKTIINTCFPVVAKTINDRLVKSIPAPTAGTPKDPLKQK